MVRLALDYIAEDEQALLWLLCGYGTRMRPAEEETHERT